MADVTGLSAAVRDVVGCVSVLGLGVSVDETVAVLDAPPRLTGVPGGRLAARGGLFGAVVVVSVGGVGAGGVLDPRSEVAGTVSGVCRGASLAS